MGLVDKVSWIKPAFRTLLAIFSMVALIIVCFHQADQAFEWNKRKLGFSNPFFLWYCLLVIVYCICFGILIGLPYIDNTVIFYTFPVIGAQGFFWIIFKFFYPTETLDNWIVVVEAHENRTYGLGDSEADRKRKVIQDPHSNGKGIIHFTNTEGWVILAATFFLSLMTRIIPQERLSANSLLQNEFIDKSCTSTELAQSFQEVSKAKLQEADLCEKLKLSFALLDISFRSKREIDRFATDDNN